MDHLEKLEEVLKRLNGAGLKVNVEKSMFCTDRIEYLGYVLTRTGVKPQSKKIKAILSLQAPTNVKSLRTFLGMVKYYRDAWLKRSEMLTPLTDLVGKYGQTKTTKKNNTKKKPWHWDEVHQQAFESIKKL